MSRRSRRARQIARILAARQAQDEYPATPPAAPTRDIAIVPGDFAAAPDVPNPPDPAPITPPDPGPIDGRVARILRHARDICLENSGSPDRFIGRGGTVYKWEFVQDQDPLAPIAVIYSIGHNDALIVRKHVLIDPTTLSVVEGLKFFIDAGTRADREEAEALRHCSPQRPAPEPTPPAEPEPPPPAPTPGDDAATLASIVDRRGLAWTLRNLADACETLMVRYAEWYARLEAATDNGTGREAP
jgi:hypothetical protein